MVDSTGGKEGKKRRDKKEGKKGERISVPTPARDFPPIFFPTPRIRHWFFVNNALARARVYGSNTREQRENGGRPAGGQYFPGIFLSLSLSRAQRDVRGTYGG